MTLPLARQNPLGPIQKALNKVPGRIEFTLESKLKETRLRIQDKFGTRVVDPDCAFDIDTEQIILDTFLAWAEAMLADTGAADYYYKTIVTRTANGALTHGFNEAWPDLTGLQEVIARHAALSKAWEKNLGLAFQVNAVAFNFQAKSPQSATITVPSYGPKVGHHFPGLKAAVKDELRRAAKAASTGMWGTAFDANLRDFTLKMPIHPPTAHDVAAAMAAKHRC